MCTQEHLHRLCNEKQGGVSFCGLLPRIVLRAVYPRNFIFYLEHELALLQMPHIIGTHKGKVTCFDGLAHGLRFPGLEVYLREGTQSPHFWNETGMLVAREKEHAHLALTLARVGYVYADGDVVVESEVSLVCL